MIKEVNPFIHAYEAAGREASKRAPFYATVVAVIGTQLEVSVGQTQTLVCEAADYVITNAAPSDIVVVIPVGGTFFALAIRAS